MRLIAPMEAREARAGLRPSGITLLPVAEMAVGQDCWILEQQTGQACEITRWPLAQPMPSLTLAQLVQAEVALTQELAQALHPLPCLVFPAVVVVVARCKPQTQAVMGEQAALWDLLWLAYSMAQAQAVLALLGQSISQEQAVVVQLVGRLMLGQRAVFMAVVVVVAVVAQTAKRLQPPLVAQEAQASPSLQPISNMTEQYAILDAQGGWLVNTVLWDGDAAKWQPPAGTNAVRLADIDLATLPLAPAPEAELVTAEEAVSQYFSPYQTLALQRFEMALLQAGKPLGPKMTACKQWLETVMLGWAMNPVAAPSASFGSPAATFEEASAEAVQNLQQT
jgi:hypothetical protein